MVPQLGFKTDTVTYKRAERFAGQSKYPLKKMLALAVNGITSFSVKPLQLVFWLGLPCAFGGFGTTVVQLVLAVVPQVGSLVSSILLSRLSSSLGQSMKVA